MYRMRTIPPLFSLRREMDRLFDDAFGATSAAAGNGNSAAWTPAADVREAADAWHFEIELPGVSPEQVEVTADKGVLTVKGEKAATLEGDQAGWKVSERIHGTFRRSFQLPQQVAEERIEARFANGVLTVVVPKVAQPAARRIEVKA